jgi:hypothetical protein
MAAVLKMELPAMCQGLTPVIQAIQETKIRRIMVQSQPSQIVQDPILQNVQHKEKVQGLAGWLKRQSACLASMRS